MEYLGFSGSDGISKFLLPFSANHFFFKAVGCRLSFAIFVAVRQNCSKKRASLYSDGSVNVFHALVSNFRVCFSSR